MEWLISDETIDNQQTKNADKHNWNYFLLEILRKGADCYNIVRLAETIWPRPWGEQVLNFRHLH